MWRELIDAITENLEEHWIKAVVAAGFMLAGWFFGRRKERQNWLKREFLDRINVSLNRIDNGTLKIRTLIEKQSDEIFLNKHAVATLRNFAGKTVPGEPIIPLPKEDAWFYLNAVLNEISEKYSDGQIAAETGLPVEKQTLLICLTNEADGEIRTRKIRAMVIGKQQLLKLPEEMPKLERKSHETRWKTLKHLAEAYQKTPWYFIEVEIVMQR